MTDYTINKKLHGLQRWWGLSSHFEGDFNVENNSEHNCAQFECTTKYYSVDEVWTEC